MNFAIRFLLLVVGFSVFSSLALTAQAQTSASSQGRSRNDPVQRELQRQYEMEIIENALKERPSSRSQRYPESVLALIREDFMHIQVVARKLMQTISKDDPLNLPFVTKSAVEIRKRVVRLKKNLALSESDSVERPRDEGEAKSRSLRFELSTLNDLIEQFVSNPMFKEARLADVESSAKARRDLDAIIVLSAEVKSRSEKLQKY